MICSPVFFNVGGEACHMLDFFSTGVGSLLKVNGLPQHRIPVKLHHGVATKFALTPDR